VAKAKSRQVQRAQQRARAAHHPADSERTNRLLIVGGIVAVIVIALGVIGFGWYQTQIRPLAKTVLTVGDSKFNLAHLERRMKLELKENPFYTSEAALRQLPAIVYERLVDQGKLLKAGPELPTITLTEEDLNAKVRSLGGLADDVDATVFAAEFRRQVGESGLKENEYRQMLQAEILRDKVRGFFIYTSPAEEEQVLARWIVVDSQEGADAVLQRLGAGEDFVAVGQDVSLDVPRAEQGNSEDDWAIRGTLPETLEGFLFDEANPGDQSGLVITGDYFYIAELLDRDESRPLGDTQRANVGEREMRKWLDGLDVTVHRNFSQEDAVRALNDVLPG